MSPHRCALLPLLSLALLVQPEAKFDVASIKANHSGSNAMGNHFTEQQATWTNATLKGLLMNVYRLRNYQLIGAPTWLDTERWDIDAKTEGKTTTGQKFQMIGPLLAERFHLQFHRETREMPVYRLIIAKGGAKMTEVKDGEPRSHPAGISNRPSHLTGWAMPLGSLAGFPSGSYLDQPIIDATGLTGNYDFDLK